MLRPLCASALLLSTLACGGSNSTAPTPTQANITVTLSPNPVTSTDCSPTCQASNGRLFRWRVQGTLTIQETSGIGGNVNSITVTSFTPQLLFGSDVIVQRSGTNHVTARGVLIFPLDVFHGPVDTPNAPRQTVMPFVVDFTDDRGNHLTSAGQWSVN
jgi:hypothetical protein